MSRGWVVVSIGWLPRTLESSDVAFCGIKAGRKIMHAVNFLQDLAVVMLVAGLVTIIFHRFKQPVVLGYIMAGVIIGPHTPPYALIHEEATINTLSELGVILLMFSLGLEFSLRKLTRVGVPALIAALMEILLLFWVGYEIGHFFAWPLLDSIFLGAMLSMSSTTIIIKVLGELGKMKERFAQLIFGILIIEDILGIAMIALLSGIAMTGKLSVGDVGVTLGKLGIFLAVTLVVGLLDRAAPDRLCGPIQEQRDVDHYRAGLVFWRIVAGGETGLQRGAGRICHRRRHRRGSGNPPGGSAAGTRAGHVQRHLLCGHRAVD